MCLLVKVRPEHVFKLLEFTLKGQKIKYYKGEINDTLNYELRSKDSMSKHVQELVDKITYNYNVSVEEFKKEFEIQLEKVKEKVEEAREYFESFKGKIIDKNGLKYNLKEFCEISIIPIATLPTSIVSEEDKEKLREVINFKLEKDVIYVGPMYLESYIDKDDHGESKLIELEYVIDSVVFNGLKECKMKHIALRIAIYNKIGTLIKPHSVFLEDFEALLEGDITMKGFIKKFDITKKKAVC